MAAPDASVVAAECARRIDALGPWLGLAPWEQRNGLYTPLNPTRGDRRPGSFVIYGGQHARPGGWVEYALGGQGAGMSGDALDLIGYVKTGEPRNRREAYRHALRFLGWEGADALGAGLDRGREMARRAALERDRKDSEERAAGELADKRRQAFARWLKDDPLAIGQPAWTYLAGKRGIDLARLRAEKRWPNALRYRGPYEYLDRKTGALIAVGPSLSALITGADGKPLAVHRTYLLDDGADKIAGDNPRKMWPAGWAGGAIRLAKGVSGLAPKAAGEKGVRDVLCYGEGIETSLSVALHLPDWRVWAGVTLGNLGRVIWPANTRAVVLLKDRTDIDKATSEDVCKAEKAWTESLLACARQAKARSLPLYIAEPQAGAKDWNDRLRAIAGQIAEDTA